MSDKQLVIVTGASGFIALHAITQLLAAGFAVRGTLRDTSRAEDLSVALSRHCDISALSFAEADLLDDAGWDEAMVGATYLLHMASPLPIATPRDENDLIVPARDGALRAIRAAAKAGVTRIVMTSSIAAIYGGQDKNIFLDENYWSDVTQSIGAYPKSKTMAEQAAWEYIRSLDDKTRPEFVSINPGFVLGPLIAAKTSASHEVVRRLIAREVPGIPDIGFNLVDVRDVASAHVEALRRDAAPKNRYICITELLSLRQIAEQLQIHLGPRGYKIPTRHVPDWVIRLIAIFNPSLKVAAERLGPSHRYDTSHVRSDLDWRPIPMHQSILDTADSLIDLKIIDPQ
ncbi:NAD-dependent epimerase/dehydratase family protein [Sneathiella sp.]|uniref:NAD-dependent epimerase/dehydratase family protein n=1 Tax=Sneathiella sp. TaxID=1964365 RepID=UPI0035625C0E